MSDKTNEKWTKHFADTEGRYFFVILLLTVFFFYTGITYGLTASPEELKSNYRNNYFSTCPDKFPKSMCEAEKKLFDKADFTKEFEAVIAKADGADDEVAKRMLLDVLLPVLEDPIHRNSLCKHSLVDKDATLSPEEQEKLCFCFSDEGSRNVKEIRKTVSMATELTTIQNMMDNGLRESLTKCMKQ